MFIVFKRELISNKNSRRMLIFFLCATLLIMPFSAFFAISAANTKINVSNYTDYREIPGITETEIQNIEKIKDSYKKLTLGVPFCADSYSRDNELISGFMMYLSEKLSVLFDIPFTLVIGDEGTPVSTVQERQNYDFYYEISAHKSKMAIDTGIPHYVHAFRIDTPPNMLSKHTQITRYAVIENSPIPQNINLMSNQIELKYVSDYNEAIELLETGMIDAFLDYDTADIEFYSHPDIVSSEFLPLITGTVCVATLKPGLLPIISVLGKYMINGGKEEITELYTQGLYDYNRHKLYFLLSEEEKNYIDLYTQSDSFTPFAASYDNYPICFYNEEMKEYQGISIDVLNEIEKLTGLKFQPSNSVGTPWYELLNDLINKRTTFVSELMYTPARSEHFIWPEEPYAQNEYVLVSRVTEKNIVPAEIPNHRVGVIVDTAYTDVFHEWFPDYTDYVEYIYYKDAFTALLEKEVDFIMGTQNLLLYSSHYLQESGIKANIVFDHSTVSAFGFNQGEEILCSIFTKAQRLIDLEKISQSWEYKVFDYKRQADQERMLYFIGIGVLAVILIILLLILVLKTVNEKRRLETTVQTRTSELEKQVEVAKIASSAKSTFLARMSHELRTPLNAILGMANIAFQESAPESKARGAIGDTIVAATHLLHILNDLLDMTQIESNELSLVHAPFHIRDAMQATLNLFPQSCAEKNITMDSNLDSVTDYIVIGDIARLKQVIVNFLSNAVKFTPQDGAVYLSVECEIENRHDEDYVIATFSVKDTGIGIPPDEIENIFKAFEQANSTTSPRFGGIGIGLSISQNIVEKMGGKIYIESEIDKGSVFSFTIALPLFDISEKESAEPVIPELDCSGKRALIVDDIEINRIILLDILEGTNAELEEAGDGLEALQMFENSEPFYYDFIFMDIQMPKMDGYESAQTIRALNRPDAKTIPIIAVTANAYQEDIEKAMNSGINVHIAKPVDIAQFMSALESLMNI